MTTVGATASSEEVGSAAVENTSPTFPVTDLLSSEVADDDPAGLTSPEETGEETGLPSLGMDMAAAVSEIMNKLEGGAGGGTESTPPMLPPAKVAESLLAPGPEIVVISTPAAVPLAENQAAAALSSDPNTAAPLAVNSGLSPEDVAAAWILQQIAAASSSPSGATASGELEEPPSQSNLAAMENKEADFTAPVTESFAGEPNDVASSGEVDAAQPTAPADFAASTSSPGQPEAAAGEPITPSSVQLVSDQIIVDGAAVASSAESGMVVDGAAVASPAEADMVPPLESISSAPPVEPVSSASIDSLLSVPTEATISPTLDPSITVPALSLSSVPVELASDSTAKVPEDVATGAPDPVAPIISAPETSVTPETLAVPEVTTPETSSKSPEAQPFSGAPEVAPSSAPEVNTSSNAPENNSSSVAPEASSSSGTAEVSSSPVAPEMSLVSDAPEVGSSTGAPPETASAAGTNSSTGAPPETAGAAGTNSSTGAPPETAGAAGTNSSTGAPPETAGAAGTNSSTGAPPETAGSAGTNTSTGAPVSNLGPSGILPLTSGTLGQQI